MIEALQHTATHCNTLQHTYTPLQHTLQHTTRDRKPFLFYLVVNHFSPTLQHTATHYYTRQHTATHCNTLQHTATHCNTLQRTATPCNTRQHTATPCNTLQHPATPCNTLQHTATHCNTLQHTAEDAGILEGSTILKVDNIDVHHLNEVCVCVCV